MKTMVAVCSILLFAVNVSAQFEGIIKMRMKSSDADGTLKMSISPAGAKNEMDINMKRNSMNMRMTMLVKFSQPDVVYRINDAARSYSEMNVKDSKGKKGSPGGKVTVKKLGSETVAGYLCQHVLVTGGADGETEFWTTREILDFASFAKIMGPETGGEDALRKALQGAGADGFVVKSVHRADNGEIADTVELVAVEKKTLPASLFEIPSGYKKEDGPMGMNGPAGAMPPEAMKAMQEQMKNMPPEQREMMKRMMEQNGGN